MAPSNLALRLLTAGVGGPLILGVLYLSPPLTWLAVVVAAGAIGAYELFGMTHRSDGVARGAASALTVAFLAGLWFAGHDARALMTMILAMPLAAMALCLWRLGDVATSATRVMAVAFGPLYVGGGLGALAMLRRDAGADGPGFAVLALVLAWLSDTGGYFAGRFLGRRKLYEAVSPKKTVEGAVGGVAGSVAGALLAHLLYVRSLPLLDAVLLGVVGSASGQLGDLGESLLKRSSGVKDSGGIIPGHGGILDRIDAVLITSVITYLYVRFARPTG